MFGLVLAFCQRPYPPVRRAGRRGTALGGLAPGGHRRAIPAGRGGARGEGHRRGEQQDEPAQGGFGRDEPALHQQADKRGRQKGALIGRDHVLDLSDQGTDEMRRANQKVLVRVPVFRGLKGIFHTRKVTRAQEGVDKLGVGF